jgi:gp16 family phage-associated protein
MSKTREQVKADLIAQGKSVVDWAREHGFNVWSVRAVLYGHNKGHRGQCHHIAVALGIKALPE